MKKKPLYIPISQRYKGLTAYCHVCNTDVCELCKLTGKNLKKCEHGERHVFKCYSHIPGSSNKRKTRTFKTRDINEATKLAIEFHQEVKSNSNRAADIKSGEKSEKQNPRYLVNHAALFCSYMRDENVPSHLKKDLSEDYLKDLEREMEVLCECLQKREIDLSTFTMEDINDNVVGLVNDFLLEDKKFSNRSFNKYMTTYSSFMDWWLKDEKSNAENFFSKVPRKSIAPNPETLESREEFEALLALITPENGIQLSPGKKKEKRNLYQPWLKQAYRLALESGARRENLAHMKMSDVVEDKFGVPIILNVENIKVNRIMHLDDEKLKRFIPIPITKNLRELIIELGYEEYKKIGIDQHLIAPEIKENREGFMCDLLSRSFAHFYSKLNNGRKRSFGSLRKAYITQMEIYSGGKSETLVGHSNSNTKRHYVVPAVVAKASRNFQVFPERSKELQDQRAIADEKQTKKTIDL